MIMKTLNQYIQEKLIINKDYRDAKIAAPKTFDELRKIIEDRYEKLGHGTKQKPIDFNDIDVSNLGSFYDNNKGGIFQETNFKYIDISDWDVSNIKSMRYMFAYCETLESVGNLLKWNVSKVTNMSSMFYGCKSFNQDISNWNVSKVNDMTCMFDGCKSFNQDISDWDVSKVQFKTYVFLNCPIKEEYKPKFK